MSTDGNETTTGGGRKGSKVASLSSGSKGRKGSCSEGVAWEISSVGGRDSALFLFRALGKILYCKR